MKILVLQANPRDTQTLRLGDETREIEQRLKIAQDNQDLPPRLIVQGAVRPSDLQTILQQHPADILHYSGHGNRRGQLVLESGSGASKPVEIDTLGAIFAA